MSNLPQQQKAVIFNTTTDALSFTSAAQTPSPHDGHVIKVHSTAITNGELTWAPFVDWPTLHVPCYDVSGTVVTEVAGSPFKVGDAVFGRVHAGREGTAREYATLLPSEAALVPEGLGLEDASAIPMSALTAWQAVFEKGLLTGSYAPASVPRVTDAGEIQGAELAKGKRVLVLGAAGGVGMMAIQFARLAGAYVAGTASGRNDEFVRGLGAEVIDYTTTSLKEYVGGEEGKKFDLVLGCVGGNAMLDGWNAVKDNGTYICVTPGFREPDGGKPAGVRSEWFVMDSRGSELAAIGRFIEKGLVKGWVDSVWKMEDFEKAFAKTATGHARGKVVIKIAQDEE
ncbi:NAD(P)-binding protein [Paraphaeosphaeria sporulosa]|uniref:NAD(P)-binding protein n=1 Tax=Paraphaeosphaeria sporulosa TaxID=1460663 RepID=A0A177C5M3_9PLEO|nr:NAD(P)-binding protein [Paraphaeosphaeria sporulosa]OAG03054.1 NAD(P)-binding protein [Paraphaeosphaeria sporulosa]